jgi:hypothetical protein
MSVEEAVRKLGPGSRGLTAAEGRADGDPLIGAGARRCGRE